MFNVTTPTPEWFAESAREASLEMEKLAEEWKSAMISLVLSNKPSSSFQKSVELN